MRTFNFLQLKLNSHKAEQEKIYIYFFVLLLLPLGLGGGRREPRIVRVILGHVSHLLEDTALFGALYLQLIPPHAPHLLCRPQELETKTLHPGLRQVKLLCEVLHHHLELRADRPPR